jgi:RNA polymerase sigma-70 factor (ECF subfamily)
VATRSNTEWLDALQGSAQVRDVALAELHAIIKDGLPHALQPYLRNSHPSFNSLIEEVTQETMIKILASLGTFEGRSQFTTWAHKIAIHVALSELRRRKWREVSLDELVTMGDDVEESSEENNTLLSDKSQRLDQMIEKSDLLYRVRKVINEALTERQRKALVAIAITETPVEEVARQMQMERNAVYKLMHDARTRLKKRLMMEGISVNDVFASLAD